MCEQNEHNVFTVSSWFTTHPVAQRTSTIMARPVKVVVVGGGFAGIGALSRLVSNPRFQITLLEASSRIGGRVCSMRLPDSRYAVELGATYLHGEEGNSLYEIARKKGMALRNNDLPKCQHKKSLNLLSNGEEIPDEEFFHYGDVITSLIEEVIMCGDREDWSITISSDPKWAKKDPAKVPSSFTDYVSSRFLSVTKGETDSIRQKYPGSTWQPKHIMEHLMLKEGVANASPLSLDVDIASYGEFEFPLGDEIVQVKDGYKSLIEELTKDLMVKQCVQLNKVVTHIHRIVHENGVVKTDTSYGPVILTCSDGSVYHADHVIVTVSLGVLKKSCMGENGTSISGFFSPPLPTPKLDAIRRLGFGAVHKVALEFSQPITADDYVAINLFWLEDDWAFPAARGQYTFERVGDTNIWATWFCGQDAVDVEDLSDQELAEEISQLLEKFLGCPVERPKAVWRANWASDPHYLGSYSYNKMGTNRRERSILGEPLDGSTPLQLLFAGEATHPTLYSTTNGAYDSGVREAERLLAHHSAV